MINNPGALSALYNDYNTVERTAVKGEWNLNRYLTISRVHNIDTDEDTDGYDPGIFPISAPFLPNRPLRNGIIKAHGRFTRIAQAGINPTSSRSYVASVDGAYKYWVSPNPSDNFWTGQGWRMQGACPAIEFSEAGPCNKIKITYESSAVYPIETDVFLRINGSWVLVARNPGIASDGTCTLYLQEGGGWTTTYGEYPNPVYITGCTVRINSMSTIGAHVDVIEISPRLRIDLSDRVTGWDFAMEVGDDDFISPMGVASSNSGSIKFSNIDKFFSDEPGTLLSGLIDRNAMFDVYSGIDDQYTKVATGLSDGWSGTLEEETTVSIADSSRILQETQCPQVLLNNKTAIECAWRILDMVGFDNYRVLASPNENHTVIPYFWSAGDKMVWEVLQDLARGTQMAIFFDAENILNIESKNYLYNVDATPVWTVNEDFINNKKPDLISVSNSYQYEANKVTVRYHPTDLLKDTSTGKAATESVWKPDDTVVLRSTPLNTNLGLADGSIDIGRTQSTTWPYTGMVNIEGELIKYDAKYYGYYNKSRRLVYTWVSTDDEKRHIDEALTSQDLVQQNFFAGRLRIKERGVYTSYPAVHKIELDSWYARWGKYDGPYSAGGANHYKSNGGSSMRIQTNGNWDGNTFYQVHRTSDTPTQGFLWAGTSLKFDSTASYTHGVAGIAMNCEGDHIGYYIEVLLTTFVDRGTNRNYTNEIRMYRRNSDGGLHPFASAKFQDEYSMSRADGKGTAFQIDKGRWYDLDVAQGAAGEFTVYLDGAAVLYGKDPAGFKLAPSGTIALFTRGDTVVDFDYAYAIESPAWPVPDQTTYFDQLKGGYSSKQGVREFVYSTRTATRWKGKKAVKYKQKYAASLFDEFGPMVHEVREMTVKFEKAPVAWAGLYSSNDYQIVVPDFSNDPFSAKFTIANSSRVNAVAQGEDTLTYGTDNPIEHQLFVYGRTVVQQDEQAHENEIEVTDNASVRARGVVSLEFDSNWLQTESAAKEMSNWILNHWSTPSDVITLDIFGNPLLELGDVILMSIPSKNITLANNKYVIFGISRDWNNGLTTTLTVRRLP